MFIYADGKIINVNNVSHTKTEYNTFTQKDELYFVMVNGEELYSEEWTQKELKELLCEDAGIPIHRRTANPARPAKLPPRKITYGIMKARSAQIKSGRSHDDG